MFKKNKLLMLIAMVAQTSLMVADLNLNELGKCKGSVAFYITKTNTKEQFKKCDDLKLNREKADCYLQTFEEQIRGEKNLTNLYFSNVYLGCDKDRFFDKAILKGTDVSGADFAGMCLDDMDLTGTIMTGARIDKDTKE
jgi:uncharacterized protein YjbI with pentapeptide repeats